MAKGGGGGGGGYSGRGRGEIIPIDGSDRGDGLEDDIEDAMIPRRRFGATLSKMGDDAVGGSPFLGMVRVRRPFGHLRFPHFGDEPFSDEQTCDEHPHRHPHHHHHHHRHGHGGQPHGDVVLKPILLETLKPGGAPKKEGFFKRVLKKITSAFHGEGAIEGELDIRHNPDGSVVMTHQPHGEVTFGGGYAASKYVGDRADFPNAPIIAADVPELQGKQLMSPSGVPYGSHIHEIGTEYNPMKLSDSPEDLLTTSGAVYVAGSDLGCGLPSVGGQLKK